MELAVQQQLQQALEQALRHYVSIHIFERNSSLAVKRDFSSMIEQSVVRVLLSGFCQFVKQADMNID